MVKFEMKWLIPALILPLLIVAMQILCVFHLHVWQKGGPPLTAAPAKRPLASTPVLWSATVRAALLWANGGHLAQKGLHPLTEMAVHVITNLMRD